MNPANRIGLIAQLRDLQIVDSEGIFCGVVDDIALTGKAGGKLRVEALIVGPGGYAKRLPRWWMTLVRLIAGGASVHVPWQEIESITSVVRLRRRAAELRLGQGEARARRLLPRIGALK